VARHVRGDGPAGKQFRCRVGDRVEVVGLMNDPDPIPVGVCGTVRALLGSGALAQIDVEWEDGRSLYLLPGDPFRVI